MRDVRALEGWETYESHKLYVGFELDPLASNSTSDGKDRSSAGPYKTGGWLVS